MKHRPSLARMVLRLQVERQELRHALQRCAVPVAGFVSDDCTHQFHCHVADEVELVIEKWEREVARLYSEVRFIKQHCDRVLAEAKEKWRTGVE